MFVSIQKKILFFHISKTAGTSVKSMLDRMCPDGTESYEKIYHTNMSHYMTKRVINRWGDWVDEDRFTHITQTDARPFFKAAGVDYSDFFCFIIVRNPYERFKSQLQYLNLLDINSIDHYIDTYQDSLNTRRSGYWFLSQMAYFKDPLTNNLNVFKFEELNKLWAVLFRYAEGKAFHVHKVNENTNKQEIKFTVGQKKRIYELFREEFETFGYKRDYPGASTL